jgi:threonyl-tRNA synthetase
MQAELQKIPYILIIGEQEEQAGTATIRKKTGNDIKNIGPLKFVKLLEKAINNKAVSP